MPSIKIFLSMDCDQGTVLGDEDMIVNRARSVLKEPYGDQLKKVEPGEETSIGVGFMKLKYCQQEHGPNLFCST